MLSAGVGAILCRLCSTGLGLGASVVTEVPASQLSAVFVILEVILLASGKIGLLFRLCEVGTEVTGSPIVECTLDIGLLELEKLLVKCAVFGINVDCWCIDVKVFVLSVFLIDSAEFLVTELDGVVLSACDGVLLTTDITRCINDEGARDSVLPRSVGDLKRAICYGATKVSSMKLAVYHLQISKHQQEQIL